MGAPILEIAGLTIGLPQGSDRAHAVQGVSLSVAANEIVCLVGESGSGKSVIAHATMGLLPRALAVTGGSIKLAGEELVGAPERRLEALRCTRMAMIFQEPMTALNPVMRCGEQIDEVLRRHTSLDAAARRAKVLEGLADVRLPDPARMASSYPHQLSGGQRQRIMIAMALVLDPKLLIADEPTTALDVTTQAQILALVRDLMREHGTGVLFITHDFGVVAEIADRVAVLKQGELVEVGTADEVLRAPKHDYTKMLIAAVPSMTPRHRDVVDHGAARRGERARQDLRAGRLALRQARGARRRRCRARDPARRDARHRRRVRLGQVDGRALHRAPRRPDVRLGEDRRPRGREAAAGAACARCAARCRSCSRTRTARSIRAGPSARRSSRGR